MKIVYSLILAISLILNTFPLSLPIKAATSEEQAIYDLNNSSLPKDAVVTTTDEQEGLLTKASNFVLGPILYVVNGASSVVGLGQLFKSPPKKPVQLITQSGSIHRSDLPAELAPPENAGIVDKVKGYLGNTAGFYPVDLPEFLKGNTSEHAITDREKAYEQANFPEGVHPITGQ